MTDSIASVGVAPRPSITGPFGPSGSTPVSAKPMVDAGSFEAVLTQLSNNAANNLKAGEATAIAGLQGKATTREVVDAVMKAEQSLQTVIAVRDKVISAYLEITRMQI